MNHIKLFVIGIVLILTVAPFFLVGCANQPVFCPEVKVTFCPSK